MSGSPTPGSPTKQKKTLDSEVSTEEARAHGEAEADDPVGQGARGGAVAVSYTHLTLPTILLV